MLPYSKIKVRCLVNELLLAAAAAKIAHRATGSQCRPCATFIDSRNRLIDLSSSLAPLAIHRQAGATTFGKRLVQTS
jgi:hypothetical protein